MTFVRSDDRDFTGGARVTYTLADCPGYSFRVIATRAGVQISGTTPPYTDYTPVNRVLTWVQYHSQKIRERGYPIPQNDIDSGTLWT